MLQPTIHPWNQELWQHLTLEPERSNHALLMHGGAGLGKRALSIALSHFVTTDGYDQSAKLFEAGSHPDIHVVMPESEQALLSEASDSGLKLFSDYSKRYLESHAGKPRQSITIDQIRKLCSALSTHPHIAKNRIIAIFSVESMNRNAANALLKSLEEPPSNTLFLLVSDDVAVLPKTIRSRCSLVNFSPPDKSSAKVWLEQQKLIPNEQLDTYLSVSNNHPLLAIKLYKGDYLEKLKAVLTDVNHMWMRRVGIVEIAKKWFDLEPRLSLDIVQKLALDLYRFKLSSSPLDLFFPVQRSWVKSSADKIDTDRLVDLLDEIIRSKQLLGTTVDALLVLETLAKRVFELPKN